MLMMADQERSDFHVVLPSSFVFFNSKRSLKTSEDWFQIVNRDSVKLTSEFWLCNWHKTKVTTAKDLGKN